MDHALHVEIAGRAQVEVFDVSLERLIRLTPRWLAQGLIPLDQALSVGRSLGLLRPSTRHRFEVPQDSALLGHSTVSRGHAGPPTVPPGFQRRA